MSVDEIEIAYDQYMWDLYQEHKKEAIEEFTSERLQSFYLNNPLLAKPAFDALTTARNLAQSNPTPSLIFAAIAAEVGFKATLIKPIVYGLVNTDAIASLITDLATAHTSMRRYRDLLFEILSTHGGLDMHSFKRSCAQKTLWEEMQEIQEYRNKVMHRAELVSSTENTKAISVASTILETVFPTVIKNLGLHLHDNFKICNDWGCFDI